MQNVFITYYSLPKYFDRVISKAIETCR